MALKDHIPNFITLLNLLSGCIAIVFAFENQLVYASYFVGLAALFDFFDGFVARLLNVKSEIGKQLDSLADVISFGLVPGVILFQLIRYSINNAGIVFYSEDIIAYFAFLVPMFSALRLAKFNIDERQSDQFIGLPTPANAILVASFPLIIIQQTTLIGIGPDFFSVFLKNTYFLVAITILLSYLLVAEIPLLSLKFKSFNWDENKVRYFFLGVSLIVMILFYFLAIPIIIVIYILLSLFQKSKIQNQKS